MAIGDVTTEGVERAIAEFDQLGRETFLDRYGFGKARGYFLVRGGRKYDSKAIVGVAHSHSGPDLEPLRPGQFSGGEARVARQLESLGFEVKRPSKNPPWSEEERILALDLYLRSGLLDDRHPDVVKLSSDLNALPVHSERPDAARFRNPNGIALKLANFAAIDPNHKGKGMSSYARGDTKVWDRYASNEDALAAAVAAIREGRELPAMRPTDPARPRVTRVKAAARHAEPIQYSVPAHDIEVTQQEERLVRAYRDRLERQGHTVTRGRYQPDDSDSRLESDLVDLTDGVLYEAKGDVHRASVRMAIGQLLDYRRFEDPPPRRLAVLLPEKPGEDLIDLILKVPASVVWQTDDGFEGLPDQVGFG